MRLLRLLLLAPLAALLLGGCAVVPIAPPFAYVRPAPRVTYVYPAYPYWYAPRYYRHW